MIFDYQLFLGFPISVGYMSKLTQVSPATRALFIQNHPDYLYQIHHAGVDYLGKYLGSIVDLASIELTRTNIYSLLRRLVEDYPHENQELMILAIEVPPQHG